nr:hypothetical protein [Nitrosomonas nitrosa]
MAQILSRVADPITSTNSLAVFHIKPEADALLRGDVRIHFGFTITTTAGNYAPFNKELGAWAAIKEIRILDGSGYRLWHLREADRYAAWQLLRMSSSATRDVEFELSRNQSAFSVYSAGFHVMKTNDNLTANASTTARVMLNLSRLCDLFSSALPLQRMGGMRIEIEWHTTAARIFSNSGVVTAFAPSEPQLSYSLLLSPLVVEKMAAEVQIKYTEPRLTVQGVGLNPADASLPLGGAGEAVNTIITQLVTAAGAYTAPDGATSAVNLTVNGKKLFPVNLDRGGQCATTPIAAGTDAFMPVGGWYPLPTNTLGLTNFAGHKAFWAVDLRPMQNAPPSVVNSTKIDSSGVYYNISATQAATTLYAYMVESRVVKV